MSKNPISLSYSFNKDAGPITGEPAYTVVSFTRDGDNNRTGKSFCFSL